MLIVGHRGARNEAPENTAESFIHAQCNGCVHFELDIQLSRDNELVVIHDTTLKRTTGVRGRVNDYTLHQLQNMDARLNTPGWHLPCRIPSLQEVVNFVPHTEHWQFEIKSDSKFALDIVARKIIDFILNNRLDERAVVTSSNKWVLHRVKQINKYILTGYVAETPFPDPAKTAASLHCNYLICHYKLANDRVLRSAKELGLKVSCWTVNRIGEMKRLKSLGVESIITDRPSFALSQQF